MSIVPPQALAGEGGDPRLPQNNALIEAEENEEGHRNVTFEEYAYYADITRAEEKLADEEYRRIVGPRTVASVIKGRFSKGGDHVVAKAKAQAQAQDTAAVESKVMDEKNDGNGPATEVGTTVAVTQSHSVELKHASRAMRTASWGSIFYLITTDILGPFTCP